ncbi:MAG TPA: hypothetical protein VEJ89_06125 [Myxococcaceae bacterium]|jgi:hypothetical protein|nr:hypothetical protein [Myxococcaceae bacterium]
MKAFFFPVVVALLAQATGSLGGAFYCRALGERVADCCCPADGDEGVAGPALAEASCCDALRAVAGAADARDTAGSQARAPERTAPAADVAAPISAAHLGSLAWAAVRLEPGGPPGRTPVFILQRSLLI